MIKATVLGTFSFRAWKRRMMRILVTTAGYWIGLTGVTASIGWGSFWELIAMPVPVLGWVIAVFGAGSSSGLEHPPT